MDKLGAVMKARQAYMIGFRNLALCLAICVTPLGAAHAQTSFDASGVNGGSIIPGADSRLCVPALAGAIRFNSTTSCVEYCDGINAWVCPNSGGGGGGAACSDPDFAWSMVYAPTPGNYGWKAIEFSQDGTVIIAGAHSENNNAGRLAVSTNGGTSFTLSGAAGNWWDVAISANGSIMAAVTRGGQIHVSTNSGTSWNTYATSLNWRSIDMSANGQIMLAAVDGGRLWVSSDTGQTWAQRDSLDRNWRGVAVSADGTRMVGAVENGRIFASTDSGANFASVTGANAGWQDIDISGDGNRIYAVNGGNVSMSTNMGTSWSTVAVPANGSDNFVVTNHNGSIIMTGNIQRTINISRNSGTSFEVAKYSHYWSDGGGISPDGTKAGFVDYWANEYVGISTLVCSEGCSSGGLNYAGNCWYTGASNQSCNQVCAARGGYNSATLSYAGSSGLGSNCEAIMVAFSGASTASYGGDLNCGGAGGGCVYRESDQTVYRCNVPATTEAAAAAGYRRFCACNQ